MQMMTLGDVAEYVNGRAFKPEEWEKEGKPIIRIQNLTNSTEVCHRTSRIYESKYFVQSGDLLFAWSASLGAHIWQGGDAWLNQHIFKVMPFEFMEKQYLFYYLLHIIDQLYAKTHGSAMAHITLKPFKSTPIPVPPLAEQQRIVDRIESLFSKLDKVRERAQAALDNLESYRGAVLREAFDGTLTAGWRQENGLDISSWRRQTLKECCKISSGGTPSRKKPEYYKGNIPWIKTGEIDWNEISDADERITELALEDSSAKLNPAGAVLVAMYGMGLTRGRAAILKVPAATNQAVCVLQPNSDVLNWYLFYYFMRNYWEIRAHAVGGNQLNLSGKIISQLQIDIPALDEQRKIADTLHSLLESAQAVKDTAEAVLGQIELMKKAILGRAFRGELGANDPSEETLRNLR